MQIRTIALTMDGQYIRLYIDGRRWFERMLVLGIDEMWNNTLSIGSGRWDEPTLNALVDDLAIYSFALNDKQIAMLDAGVDPLEEGAALPQTTAPSLPKPPTTTNLTSRTTENSGTLLGLPSWSVYLGGGLLLLFVVLTVFVSVYKPGGEKSRTGSKGGRHS